MILGFLFLNYLIFFSQKYLLPKIETALWVIANREKPGISHTSAQNQRVGLAFVNIALYKLNNNYYL